MAGGGFPTTIVSQVLAVRSDDAATRARSLDVIAQAYYKPIYKYARLRWRAAEEEAKDITQEFFATAFESDMLARYEPSRARFRTYVRVCLDRFIAKRHRAGRALKRGGAVSVLPFDFQSIEHELARTSEAGVPDADAYFESEWVRHLFGISVDALRDNCERRGKLEHFKVFERIDLASESDARPSYASVADELGITPSDVNNRLSWARRELRRIVLDKLRELTASEEEFASEAYAVLGIRV